MVLIAEPEPGRKVTPVITPLAVELLLRRPLVTRNWRGWLGVPSPPLPALGLASRPAPAAAQRRADKRAMPELSEYSPARIRCRLSVSFVPAAAEINTLRKSPAPASPAC